MLKFTILVLAFFLQACVSATKQADQILMNSGQLPRQAQIENIVFIDQSAGFCGPATLAMAMNWAGASSISVDELAMQVFTPGMNGSLQTDLISASRRHGLMAVQIDSLQSLLSEVAAGHPVIVFENLSLSWAPQWHFALVVGYDLNKQQVIMHSGHDSSFHWDLRKFERSWKLGEYWGLVVLPSGQIAEYASELANVTSAVGLEQTLKLTEAAKSYKKILDKWPTNLVALIGLANHSFTEGRKQEAIELLNLAVKYHPDSVSAKHNLALALAK